jgi:hypothetical protein
MISLYVKQLLLSAAIGDETELMISLYVKQLLLSAAIGDEIELMISLYVKQLLLPAAIAAGSSSCLTYTYNFVVYAVLSS